MKKTISAIMCLMLMLGAVCSFNACNTGDPNASDGASDASDTASHQHQYATKLSYNDEFHFKPCTVDGCTAQGSKQKHTFGAPEKGESNGKVSRTYKCKSCDYQKVETNVEYTVMSSNILGKYSQDSAEDSTTDSRMQAIADCIAYYAPDSVGFQEYGSQNKLFLKKYLPKEYAFVDFGQEWIPTIYNNDKLELVDSVCKRLTTSSAQQYCFTVAVFASRESGDLAYIHGNLHFEYKDKETRLINAEEVNDALWALFDENEDYKSLPLVITGDYNATTKSEPKVFSTISDGYSIKTASDVALSAEKNQATYHHNVGTIAGTGDAIDHVLVNTDTTQVYLHDIIKEADYPDILTASDHYPVLIEFSTVVK